MALSCSDASRGWLLARERIACVSVSRGCARGDDAGGDRPATWESLKQDAPPGLLFGWKNFYDEDQPVFSAEQAMSPQPTPPGGSPTNERAATQQVPARLPPG